jgi:hypothetical protein
MSFFEKLKVTFTTITACAVSLFLLVVCVEVSLDSDAPTIERVFGTLFMVGVALMPIMITCLSTMKYGGNLGAISFKVFRWIAPISTACNVSGFLIGVINRYSGW